jgi:hypothetical protein
MTLSPYIDAVLFCVGEMSGSNSPTLGLVLSGVGFLLIIVSIWFSATLDGSVSNITGRSSGKQRGVIITTGVILGVLVATAGLLRFGIMTLRC